METLAKARENGLPGGYPDASSDRHELGRNAQSGDLKADCLQLLQLGFVLCGTDYILLHG